VSDQDGIAALAIQVAGPVSASGGLAAAGPWESAAEELDYLVGRLSEGWACKVLNRDAGTALLAFGGADDAFYAACVVQQGDSDAAAGARHLQVRLLLDALPTGGAESPGALAALEGVREVPVKGLYATRRFVEALPPTLKIRFRIAGVDGNETFCGVRHGQLYESLCVEQECTAVAIATTRHAEPGREQRLSLRWRERQLSLGPRSPGVTIGRGGAATVRIPTEFASRTHARLGFEQTNFVLHDESTNGTFVRIDEDAEQFLHREQLVLRGQGVISLGRRIQSSATHLIYFNAT
jgi:hypothetical protein